MKTEFVTWDNCLSEQTADLLYNTYVIEQKPLKWNHRGYGRFVFDITKQEHGQMVIQDLISREESPHYNRDHFADNVSVWIQCFVPGGVLPLHREFVRSVSTVYLNKDLWGDSKSGYMEWHEATEISRLYDEPIRKGIPRYNCGNYYINPDFESKEKIFNPWHRVSRNNAQYNRYSLQIFETTQENTDTAEIQDNMEMIKQGHLQAVGWDKAIATYPEDHHIFDYSAWHPEIISTWAIENAEIIEQMTI